MGARNCRRAGCGRSPSSWPHGWPPASKEFRLSTDAPVEAYATPRRLTATVARIAERQTDLDELVSGPPVAAAFDADGQPTPAAIGFAKKNGVDVEELTRQQTPRGEYLAYLKRQRGKTAVDVLPDVLAGTLRDLAFPKQMRWDAWLDDGRGELLFGRPIRWLLFLYGGRVVPFTIRRSSLASSGSVQEVRSGPTTYGHRFLGDQRAAGPRGQGPQLRRLQGTAGRALRDPRSQRAAQPDRARARRARAPARRPRATRAAVTQTGLLEEVVDLIEYPSVVAGLVSRPSSSTCRRRCSRPR